MSLCRAKRCDYCGKAIAETPQIFIDCDSDPLLHYNGWEVESHKKMGQLGWDQKNIELFVTEKQKTEWVNGEVLQKELEGKEVLNANVLYWLLENPEHIPEEWKGKYVYFWGTVYRSSDNFLFVRCLYWNGGQWDWSYNWLIYDWNDSGPAAILVDS